MSPSLHQYWLRCRSWAQNLRSWLHEALSDPRHGKIKRALFAAALVLSLAVFWLPHHQTSLQEDLLLAGLSLWITLRAFNENRRRIPPEWQVYLLGGTLGLVASIAWLGLLRGYGESAPLLALAYPILLLFLWQTAPAFFTQHNAPPRGFASLLASLAWAGLAFILGLWLFARPDVFHGAMTAFPLRIGVLLIFPIAALMLRFGACFAPLNHAKNHLVLVVLILVPTLSVWSGNIRTIWQWSTASAEERSWTPFRYDDPTQIAQAQAAPYRAFRHYQATIERLTHKGSLPQQWGWIFQLHRRMAYQGTRTFDIGLIKQPLAKYSLERAGYARLLNATINDAFYDRLLSQPPNFDASQGFWRDIHYHAQQDAIYLADRWGRVFRWDRHRLELQWQPERLREGLVDFEMLGDAFVLLYRNRQIVASSGPDWLKTPSARFGLGGWAVDLEFLPNGEGGLIVSSRGEIASMGAVPASFPPWSEVYFEQDVITDFELDPQTDGYYLLDHFGAIHGNPSQDPLSFPFRSPDLPAALVPYWQNQPLAIDLAVDGQQRGLSIYTRTGELYTLAAPPFRETYRPLHSHPFRGVATATQPNGVVMLLESNGFIQRVP